MKAITRKLNFVLQAYTIQDFLRDMDRHDIEALDIKRSFTSYIVTLRGDDRDLNHAR